MAGRTEFSPGKFNELVLLLVHRSAADPRMSRVKLNKLLYWVDFEAFRRFGHSMSGATYLKGEHGPMAAELPARAEDELGRRGLSDVEDGSSGALHAEDSSSDGDTRRKAVLTGGTGDC